MFSKHGNIEPEVLSEMALFSGLSAADLELVAMLGKRVDAPAGTVLTDQGRFGDNAFIVVSGAANVFMNGEFVTTVHAETMIGEMALVEHRPRNATVVAETDMTLVAFGISEFKKLMESNNSVNEAVVSLLGRRLMENEARNAN